jgi:hypothetical protein|tara:strand:- start:2197 stop:2325 length:129 start_codon:yes stop_codon:yes gene_type:complete
MENLMIKYLQLRIQAMQKKIDKLETIIDEINNYQIIENDIKQ